MNRLPPLVSSESEGGVRKEMNILAMAKGDQRFVFLYDNFPESRTKLHEVFARFASDPEMAFSNEDEALLIQQAQKQEERYLPKNAA
jgi:hypothetical protein